MNKIEINIYSLIINNPNIKEIHQKLNELGYHINHNDDGNFDAYDLLENAEEIYKLLNEFLEIKCKMLK